MSLLRAGVVTLLMLFATLFLAIGLDIPVPHLPWRPMASRDIPLGILLVFAGIAVARYWTVPEDEEKLLDDWKNRKLKK